MVNLNVAIVTTVLVAATTVTQAIPVSTSIGGGLHRATIRFYGWPWVFFQTAVHTDAAGTTLRQESVFNSFDFAVDACASVMVTLLALVGTKWFLSRYPRVAPLDFFAFTAATALVVVCFLAQTPIASNHATDSVITRSIGNIYWTDRPLIFNLISTTLFWTASYGLFAIAALTGQVVMADNQAVNGSRRSTGF